MIGASTRQHRHSTAGVTARIKAELHATAHLFLKPYIVIFVIRTTQLI